LIIGFAYYGDTKSHTLAVRALAKDLDFLERFFIDLKLNVDDLKGKKQDHE